MTVDHIAMFLVKDYTSAYVIMRSIGRLAMPLFIFMAVEGVYHTGNIRNYILRLLIPGILIDLILAWARPEMIGNMLIDLALGILTVWLLRKKNFYSLLALLPAAFFVLSDFNFTLGGRRFINTEYGTFGLCIFIGFFLAYEIANRLTVAKAREYAIEPEIYCDLKLRTVKNVCAAIALFLVVTLFYIVYRIDYEFPLLPGAIGTETWCLFALVFILFYNGQRGYDRLWFKYGAYAYYPLHIVVLLAVSALF